MSFQVFAILVFAIVIPFITGLLRIKKIITGGFILLFLYVTAGLINSIVSYTMIIHHYSNHINANLYMLVSFLLLMGQFCKWNNGSLKKYLIFGVAGIAIWSADNFLINNINDNNSVFRAAFSFTILFFLVDQISKVILRPAGTGSRTTIILICIGLLVHYSFKCYFETLNLFESTLGKDLMVQLNIIMAFVNLLTYSLISTAFLCIKTQPKYFYPYWRV